MSTKRQGSKRNLSKKKKQKREKLETNLSASQPSIPTLLLNHALFLSSKTTIAIGAEQISEAI
jgi:hypothetical protein